MSRSILDSRRISDIESILWYAFGASFLLFVPFINIYGAKVRLVDIILVLLLLVILKDIIKEVNTTGTICLRVDKTLCLVLLFLLMSQLWPLFGNVTLRNHGYSIPIVNFIVPIRRIGLLSIILVKFFLLDRGEWEKLRHSILRGIVHGGVATVLWMVFQHFSWLYFRFSINQYIFSDVLGLDPGHTFVNLVRLDGGAVLRATGFSWSPGLVGPPLLMIAILYLLLPREIIGNKSAPISLLLFIGPVLSLSRTAIFGLGIFFIFLLFSYLITRRHQQNDIYGNINEDKIISVTFIVAGIATLGGIWYITFRGGVINGVILFLAETIRNPAPGVVRHLGYVIYLPLILTHNVLGAFFGYGIYTTGAGVELAVGWLPGIERAAEVHQGNWRVEPQIVSILIAGGIPGAVSFLYVYSATLTKNIRKQLSDGTSMKDVQIGLFGSVFLSSTFVLGLGYGVGGTFFLVIFLLTILWSW